MSDVNSERTQHEARESVGNRPPHEGETRVDAAMRRYLGAEMFDELHRPEHEAEKKPVKKPVKKAGTKPTGQEPDPTGGKG